MLCMIHASLLLFTLLPVPLLLLSLLLLSLLLLPPPAVAQAEPPNLEDVTVWARDEWTVAIGAQRASGALDIPTRSNYLINLTILLVDGSGWETSTVKTGVEDGVRILGQCGIASASIALWQVRAPSALRDFHTPAARRLATILAAPRPALFFLGPTRNTPAFDAEAFGSANTRTRPELRHTVWITRGAADLPETVAHELFHVLANTGSHSRDTANLMYDETAPGRRHLTAAQCAALIRHAGQHKLIRTE